MKSNRLSSAQARRRGITMIEITIASLLVAMSMSITVQVLGWVAAERRAMDRRQCAVGEAANLLERLAARPWDKLTAEAAKGMTLSESAQRALPGAELTVGIDDAGPEGDARRIAVRIRWRNRAGGWDAPARLVAWTYRGRNGR